MAQDASKVIAKCRELGVKRIVLIRHANAAPLPDTAPERKDQPHGWKKDDQMRPLTAKGLEQCAVASSWFNDLPIRGLVTSPARRATETAANMIGLHPSARTLELRNVSSIHPAGMNEFCETLFEQLGYGPLRKFFEYQEGCDNFRDYAARVCLELSEQISYGLTGSPENDCFAMFGHAVFLNAIAVLLTEACGCSQETFDSLMDMDLGETEGILLDIETGTICKKTVASQGGQNLVNACKAAGIAQIALISHGNTEPLSPEATSGAAQNLHQRKREDQLRELTDLGIQQCIAARSWCGTLPLLKQSVISSPARRARETALHMTGVESPVIAECVHPLGISDECEALVRQLGNGPLLKFLEQPGGEEHFRWYGNIVADEISRRVLQLGPNANGYSVAVFGDSVFLNAVALEALMALLQARPGWETSVQAMMDLDLGEAEAIVINTKDGTFEKRSALV